MLFQVQVYSVWIKSFENLQIIFLALWQASNQWKLTILIPRDRQQSSLTVRRTCIQLIEE